MMEDKMKIDVEMYPERFGDGNVYEMMRDKTFSYRINIENDKQKFSTLLDEQQMIDLIEKLQKSLEHGKEFKNLAGE